jgi:hypothetical protein
MVKEQISTSFFIIILIAVIISWILVQLWTTAIETFFYSYLGFSKNSALVTFLVALLFTLIFILYAVSSGEASETIKENLTGVTLSSPSVTQPIVSEKFLYPE